MATKPIGKKAKRNVLSVQRMTRSLPGPSDYDPRNIGSERKKLSVRVKSLKNLGKKLSQRPIKGKAAFMKGWRASPEDAKYGFHRGLS